MRERLFIRLYHNSSVEAAWLRAGEVAGQPSVESSGKTQEPAQGSLDQAALEAPGCRIIVLVPGVDVLLTKQGIQVTKFVDNNSIVLIFPEQVDECECRIRPMSLCLRFPSLAL